MATITSSMATRSGRLTAGGSGYFYTVFATTNPERGTRGITSFIVEARNRRLRACKREDLMGIRVCRSTKRIFANCVCRGETCSRRGRARLQARDDDARRGASVRRGAKARDRARTLDWRSIHQARQQFGQSIASFRAYSFNAADIATQAEAARAPGLRGGARRLMRRQRCLGRFGDVESLCHRQQQ